MQVDPIKSRLRAPGIKCLNLKDNVLPSTFGFNVNLRRYITVGNRLRKEWSDEGEKAKVRRCRLTLSKPG